MGGSKKHHHQGRRSVKGGWNEREEFAKVKDLNTSSFFSFWFGSELGRNHHGLGNGCHSRPPPASMLRWPWVVELGIKGLEFVEETNSLGLLTRRCTLYDFLKAVNFKLGVETHIGFFSIGYPTVKEVISRK